MGTIYILENKVDGKCYIGQTIKTFKERFRRHQISHSVIGNAIRKYGVENFNKILIENIPEEKLNEVEIEYIKKYNSLHPNGYNLTEGGDKPPTCAGNKWNLGRHFTEEHKRKISEANKGKVSGTFGKHFSEETKKKMSESGKGRHHTEETKKKMSESKKGRPFTEEHKKNLSKSHLKNKNGEKT